MELAEITNPLLRPGSPLAGDTKGAVSNFGSLINVIVSVFFVVGSLLFFLYFLLGAIKWIASSGDKAKLEEARNTIVQALIGLIVLFAVFALVKLMEAMFEVNLINLNLNAIRLK